MTATGLDSSLLYSTTSVTTAVHSHHKFEFPANPRGTVACRRNSTAALSSTNTTTAFSGDDSSSASLGRRRTILVATAPIFLNLPEFVGGFWAKAAAVDEYTLIKEEARKVLSKNKAPGVLRLVFHDAGTFEVDEDAGGMNGSIVYEIDRPENTGLKKPLKIIEKAKAAVDMIQPVSMADMIAVAGAEAVSLCGGPSITVRLGRLDSMVPDPEGKLPEEYLDASALKQCFQRKGFTTQELVALSGAHTLGSKGFGSPTVFDNSYYKILLEKPWSSGGSMSSMVGLPSDRALVEDDECLRWITRYANDQDLFFKDFKNVYVKLVDTGARWKT